MQVYKHIYVYILCDPSVRKFSWQIQATGALLPLTLYSGATTTDVPHNHQPRRVEVTEDYTGSYLKKKSTK